MRVLSVLIVVLISTVLLCSQEQTGGIIGVVALEDGTVVSDAVIKIRGTNLVGVRKTLSDNKGRYRVFYLPPGHYSVTFSLDGFKDISRKGIVLEVGKLLKIDGVMQLAALKDEVAVQKMPPVIDLRKSLVAENIRKETIIRLPRSRDFSGVLSNFGSINRESGNSGEGYSLEGASTSENSFFVDGMDTTTIDRGIAGQRVDYDSIDEIHIKYSGQSAEFSGSMGGVISVITKRGGNEFHGDLRLYYEDRDWRGDPNKILTDNPWKFNSKYYKEVTKDGGHLFEAGISLGGYIIKNRLWFYTSFIPGIEKIGRKGFFLQNNNGNGEYFELKNKTFKGTARLSAAVSGNLRLTLSGTYNSLRREGDLPKLDGTTDYSDITAKNRRVLANPELTIAGNLDYSLGNNLFVNIAGGYFRSNKYNKHHKAEGTQLKFYNTNSNVEGANDIKPGGWSNVPDYTRNLLQRNVSRRKNLKLDLTGYFNIVGEHVLKSGVFWSNDLMDKSQGAISEQWTFFWKDGNVFSSYHDSGGNDKPVDYGYVVASLQGIRGKADIDRWGFYLQDSWTPGERLTLNIGVRLENENIPQIRTRASEQGKAIKFGLLDKIAPRLGFVYDIRGDGKDKLFGSVGIYFDTMKLNVAAGYLGGARNMVAVYNIATPVWYGYSHSKSVIWTGSSFPVQGGELLDYYQQKDHALADIEPDIKPYSKVEISLGYQRMLSEDISLTVRYLYNRVLNAVEDVGFAGLDASSLYVCNPGSDWINRKYELAAALGIIPAGIKCTKPERLYRLLQINVDKSFSDNWLGGVSLSYSILQGNFTGLASQDYDGRQNPNMQMYFDSWFIQYDSRMRITSGRLPGDRPVQLKLYGAYSFDFGLTAGISGVASSGTPVSRTINMNGHQNYYPEGRMSDGRTPFFWQIDMYMEYEFKLSKKFAAALSLNIQNLTDNRISVRKYNNMIVEMVSMPNDILARGFNVNDLIDGGKYTKDSGFLMNSAFQSPIQFMLGARFSF